MSARLLTPGLQRCLVLVALYGFSFDDLEKTCPVMVVEMSFFMCLFHHVIGLLRRKVPLQVHRGWGRESTQCQGRKRLLPPPRPCVALMLSLRGVRSSCP